MHAFLPSYSLHPFKELHLFSSLAESQMNVLIRVKLVLICRHLMSYFDRTRISNDLKNSADETVKQSGVISNELGYVFFHQSPLLTDVFDNNAI